MKFFRGVAAILMAVGMLPGSVTAQDLPIGAWRTHFSYNNIKILERGGRTIFCVAENGLFYVNQDSRQVNILTKVDGLSDADISAIRYDEPTGTLIIGYESGLIDILRNRQLTTITDLKASQLVGDKRINAIESDGQNAYAGTAFGVIVIALDRREITDNYRSIGEGGSDVNVQELKVFDDRLFAITDNTIQYGALANNLLDFNNWSIAPNDSTQFRSLTSDEEALFAIYNDTCIVRFDAGNWSKLPLDNHINLKELRSEAQNIYALSEHTVSQLLLNELRVVETYDQDYQINTFLMSDGVWLGDQKRGLIPPSGPDIFPNGPQREAITNITFADNRLFAFFGSSPEYYDGAVDSVGYSVFDNRRWTNEEIDGFYNITDVARFNGGLYFSSTGYGLYSEVTSDTISGLGTNLDGYGALIPSLTVADKLYMPSFRHTNAMYSVDAEGLVEPHPAAQIGTNTPLEIQVSRGGTFWMTLSTQGGGGIIAFDLEDQDFRNITTADNLPSISINGLAIDLSDEAWIATNSGPAIFPDATFVFDQLDAIRPIFDNTELFEDESVTAIAVDGGNRVWMSTREGLWVFDNSISTLVAQFTEANSPIPSNEVTDMAYNPNTGEMYMLTTKGLVAYRSNSSAGRRSFNNVKIFPNPVWPGYQGEVGISGLMTNTNVKITDVNGKLVREVSANGGTASWDLNDYNGRRVESGVYILFSATLDGQESYVGKLAVISP